MKEVIQNFSINYPYLYFPLLILLSYLLFRMTRFALARLSYRLALKTETIYDDLFVDQLQPFNFSWLVPLAVIHFYSDIFLSNYPWLKIANLILILWFLVSFVISILSGINDVYKNSPRYTGESVAGYIGLVKVLMIVFGLMLTISLLTEIDLVTLLSGIGTWLAVLLLIFRDTILSFLASIQISSQKLIKEGDSVDIPAYGASGTVSEIDLQMIKVQNFDNTVTAIPTSKIVETGFKNYRVMIESGSRRLKKAILIDVNSIKFTDKQLIEKIKNTEFLRELIDEELLTADNGTTNLQLLMSYIRNFLRTKKEVRQRRYPFVIRTLEHTTQGLPLEIYAFVKLNSWEKFEEFQGNLIVHLFAILPYFDLTPFREG